MDPRTVALWLVALCASPCTAPPASINPAVTTRSPVSVSLGQATTLPCWLSQQQSAEDLEIRWYRPDGFDIPVMHYQSNTFKAPQQASYVGRVSFGVKDAASGGLKAGDVSLKLLDVTTEDAGDYVCYVSSSQGYDSVTVRLRVTETGSQPFLSAVWTEDNRVNASCDSEGWYPQPVLRWSHKQQELTPGGLLYRNMSSGLVSVHSWCLLPPSSSEFSCSVGLPGKEAKEAKVRLEPAKTGSSSGSSAGGWVAFGLLFVATLVAAALGALYFKKKWKSRQSGGDQPDGNYKSRSPEENEKLLKEEAVQLTSLSEASSHYVNVKLEATNNSYLTVKNNMVRDAPRPIPDGDRVTCLTAITGKPGFSSGRHYWEVSLGKHQEPGIKRSWWVGVTSAAEIPPDSTVSPNTSHGFWFLSSSPERADSFEFSTEPKILIPVRRRPQTVGVYVDRDSGEVSFYNVEDKSLIGSFTATFKGDIFPLFNPGKGDKSPMGIIQREEQSQAGDTGNCE